MRWPGKEVWREWGKVSYQREQLIFAWAIQSSKVGWHKRVDPEMVGWLAGRR